MNWKTIFFLFNQDGVRRMPDKPKAFFEEKRVLLSSITTILSFGVCIALIIFSVLVDNTAFLTVNLCWSALFLIAFILHWKGFHLASRLLTLNTILVGLYVSVVLMGTSHLGNGGELVLFPLIVATLLLFGNKHRKIIFYQLLAIGLFLPFWLAFSYFGEPIYELSPQQSDNHLRLIFISCLICTLIGCLALANVNSHWEWLTSVSMMKNRALSSAIPDLIIRFHRDGSCLSIKRDFARTIQAPVMKNGVNLKSSNQAKELVDTWLRTISLAIDENDVQQFEYDQEVDGKSHFYEVRMMKSGANEATCIIRDITKTTKHKQEISALKEFYEQILSEIRLDIVVFDNMLNYVFISEFTVKDKELREWMIGKNCLDYAQLKTNIPKKIAENRNAQIQRVIDEKRIISFPETVLSSETGKTLYKSRVAAPILDQNGEVRHVIGYGFDVTALIEKELQLGVQNKELKKLNEELDRFVYSVSHDLRSPIASCLGIIELSKTETNSQQLKEYRQLQEKSLIKLDQFIGDILNYSRNNRLQIKSELVDLEDLIYDLLANHSYQKKFRHIRANIQMENKNGVVFFSDLYRLTIILGNLISNALRYHNPRSPDPYIAVKAIIEPKHAHITVEDNGIGIAEEHLAKIFDMFYRANDIIKGSGLGLYIVKEAVEKLQGEVSVTSSLGQGSTFIITLPNLRNDDLALKSVNVKPTNHS